LLATSRSPLVGPRLPCGRHRRTPLLVCRPGDRCENFTKSGQRYLTPCFPPRRAHGKVGHESVRRHFTPHLGVRGAAANALITRRDAPPGRSELRILSFLIAILCDEGKMQMIPCSACAILMRFLPLGSAWDWLQSGAGRSCESQQRVVPPAANADEQSIEFFHLVQHEHSSP
jgi:hypothetical protein